MFDSNSPRAIPSIDRLRQREDVCALVEQFGQARVIDALRAAADAMRVQLQTGANGPSSSDTAVLDIGAALVAEASHALAGALAPTLRRVINATGVILHTNLGRAPLPHAAGAQATALATGYSTLEYDLAAGERGSRHRHAERLLVMLTGAAAATVVNNNAAATLLLLSALARGREVLISRGELVEIGGGFRVPDIMAQSGAILREVGTTNRTRVSDYAAALSPRSALILRVHPSNFRVEGFTERPDITDLANLAHGHGVPLVEDIGSGHLGVGPEPWRLALAQEPSVRASIAAGADLVCFSGDKLLGGPQAGILVGRTDLIAQGRRHPLMRAVRPDKITLAALEQTLLAWLTERTDLVPVVRMTVLSYDELAGRVARMRAALNGVAGLRTEARDGHSTLGGGSAPGSLLPTCLLVLAVHGVSADELASRLRSLPVPVVGRIEQDQMLLDLRTVAESEDAELVATLTLL